MNTLSAFERPFLSFPEIETDRLVLRKIRPSDAYSYHQHHSTIYDSPFWEEAPQNLSETKKFFREIKEWYDKKESLYWGISLKKGKDIIGSCFFPEFENKRRATLGFWLSQEHQKKGLMAEALSHILDYAFSQMDLIAILAGCYTANIPSLKALKNCGFTEASQYESEYLRKKYEWNPDVIVCLLKQKLFFSKRLNNDDL
ncbi:MAG: GNAT family N-acetyltransferase [Opitutaceae bacterium]|nr:GNAT family N-acetyltransferase [Opitutaceae bacterium]